MVMVCSVVMNAQPNYKVSTEQEKKHILIEEFTGLTCSFCPEGHRIAKELVNGLQGQAYVVNMHAGPFSPKGGGLNYMTEDGDSIYKQFLPQSYPAAMINRHKFQGDEYVYQRDGWEFFVKKIKDEIANINLYMESSYDDNTRTLKVRVEGYSVEDNGGANLRLHLLINQDYIKAKQFGVSDPENYIHNHVLCDYISKYDGDEIGVVNKGEYFVKEYEYTVPEKVHDQVIKAGNLNVVSFVTSNGLTEIENVTECKPVYSNMTDPADAELLFPNLEVGETYGFNFFEGKLRNKCAEHIKTARFLVIVNGTQYDVTANCDIAPYTTGDVIIPCKYNFDEKGKASYEIQLTAINDINITPTAIGGEFAKPLMTADKNFKVVISTDRTADEDIYVLRDEDGNIIKEFGPYPAKSAKKYEESVALDEEKTYCIEVLDLFGNGILSGKKGSLTISDSEGKVLHDITPIKDFGTRAFFTVYDPLGIEGITIVEGENGRMFTIDGMATDAESSKGSIVIRNGKKYVNR